MNEVIEVLRGRQGFLHSVVVIVVSLWLGGCETLGYYGQAAVGQFQVISARRPIDKVVADPSVDPALKRQLRLVQNIRRFAIEQLELTGNRSYTSYTDLQRPFVVWNVIAAEAFSTHAKHWCFPIAGCVSYRGYFTQAAAQRYADRLRAQGYDVFVGGVKAYSTLGWFADPVLNTFVGNDEARLVALLFHEFAHQWFYLPGDTAFNESVATVVEAEGVRRWYERNGDVAALAAYRDRQRRQRAFIELVLSWRENLRQLYQQDLAEEEKHRQKRERLSGFIGEYRRFKGRWQGYSGFDNWVRSQSDYQSLNNAKLASVNDYHQWVPLLQRELLHCRRDLRCFRQRVQVLAKLDAEGRIGSVSQHRATEVLSTDIE